MIKRHGGAELPAGVKPPKPNRLEIHQSQKQTNKQKKHSFSSFSVNRSRSSSLVFKVHCNHCSYLMIVSAEPIF